MVAFPASLPEQKRIVSILDVLTSETQHLELIYQRKLSALDALKKSLLHEAFAGNLQQRPMNEADTRAEPIGIDHKPGR